MFQFAGRRAAGWHGLTHFYTFNLLIIREFTNVGNYLILIKAISFLFCFFFFVIPFINVSDVNCHHNFKGHS